jgi:hypothetical protein
MRKNYARKFAHLAVCLAGVAGLVTRTAASPPAAGQPAAAAETIACRILEAHPIEHPKVTLVIFRHRDQKERARMGGFLRERSGASVQFKKSEGQWRPATVLRLKSCFGRGALLIEGETAELAEGDEFVLQFP